MSEDGFTDLLVSASRALGTPLALGLLLGVDPQRVYYWIARIEQPSEAQRRDLESRLAVLMAEQALGA